MDRTHRACSLGAWSVVVGVLVEEGVLQCVAVCCSVLQCVAVVVVLAVLEDEESRVFSVL